MDMLSDIFCCFYRNYEILHGWTDITVWVNYGVFLKWVFHYTGNYQHSPWLLCGCSACQKKHISCDTSLWLMAFQCQFNVRWDAWGLLSSCLYHFPSVPHLLFEVGPCLFYYLHLWHSSHHSVVIITVTVCSGLHSARLLSAPLQRSVSGSCYCGFMSQRPIRAPSLAVQWSTSFFSIEQFRLCIKNLDCLLLQCQPMVGPAHVVLTFENNWHLQ